MPLKPQTRRPIGKQSPPPARAGKASPTRVAPPPDMGRDLALPHERDQSPTTTTAAPLDPVIAQAKRDIDAGLVDTDMRATPGLDAKLRAKLVPGPGGKPPTSGG